MDGGVNYLKFVAAFVFVMGLMLLLGHLARRFDLARWASASITGGAREGRERRLRIVEQLPVDGRRRLVLIRRDDVEHLVMLGQQGGETVIETGIPARGDGAGIGRIAQLERQKAS